MRISHACKMICSIYVLVFPLLCMSPENNAAAEQNITTNAATEVLTSRAASPEWVRVLGKPGTGLDEPIAVKVDDHGYVYVTGQSKGTTTLTDYLTIKYAPDGAMKWMMRYNGPANGDDYPSGMALDSQGNVYVTGSSYHGNGSIDGNTDFATVKYDTNGKLLWARRYNGTGKDRDRAAAIAVDAAGNVYVAGDSNCSGYRTLKYDTEGNLLWVRFCEGYSYQSEVCAMAVDAAGNVFVTGTVGETYGTLKYDKNGNLLWAECYHARSFATGLALDASGNVYVTGNSLINSQYGYGTVKYDTNGNVVWTRTYNGAGNGMHRNDIPHAIVVDASGNVYVTGESSIGPNEGETQYATVKYDTNGKRLWVRTYAEPCYVHYNRAYAIALDTTGNVYVTGVSFKSGATTLKYDSNGNRLWLGKYNGKYGHWASAIAVDATGNVFVTGLSASEADGYPIDIGTFRYDPNGSLVWAKDYNGPGYGNTQASAIATDISGNVYVTGYGNSAINKDDYITAKYDSSGKRHWVKYFNSPYNSQDRAKAMAVDTAGNVYITGISGRMTLAGYVEDCLTLKYGTDGKLLWEQRYEGTDYEAMALDAAGNVYVTGKPDLYSIITLKYDTNGKLLWEKPYNGRASAIAMAVDASGNVYVVGTQMLSIHSNCWLTLKYNPSGKLLWVKQYVGGMEDSADSMALDAAGNVYVTGLSYVTGVGGYCPKTVKYDTNGRLLWVKLHDHRPYRPGLNPLKTTVDDSGNLYVSGGIVADGVRSFTTLKYDSGGNLLWEKQYSPVSEDRVCQVRAIGIDPSGNVVIVGRMGEHFEYESQIGYETLKYDTNGELLWEKPYSTPGQSAEGNAAGLAFDAVGNVYITGNAEYGGYPGILTIKHSP